MLEQKVHRASVIRLMRDKSQAPKRQVIMLSTYRSLLPALLPLVLAMVLWPGVQAAHAQNEMSPVHIEPRVRSSLGNTFGDNSSSTIRTRLHLVFLPVTITDGLDHFVVGLDQSTF